MTDIISSGEMTDLRTQVEGMIQTAALATSMSYIRVTSEAFSATTGAMTRTATTTAVSGTAFAMNMREVESDDRYKVGDIVVNIAVSDISEPNEADRISIGGVEHAVISWMKDSASARYRFVVRKV